MRAVLIVVLCSFTAIATPSQLFGHEGDHDHNDTTVKPTRRTPISFSLKVNWWLPSNSTVDRFFGGFGNEVFSLRVGVPISALAGAIEPFIEPGVLFEKARLRGATSDRESNDTSKLLLIPIRFGLAYTFMPKNWFVVPTVDAAYSLVFFDLEEDNVSVDGNKHLISVRGGFRILIDRTVNEADWNEFFGFRSAFFAVIAGQDISLVGDGLKLDGFVFGPELGITF